MRKADGPDDPAAESPSDRPRRGRSTRHPGVGLAECLALCESIERLGLDGLGAEAIASGLGYSNIRTNTFSARLSAARQFGLLALSGDGYALTGSARSILHPVDPAERPRLLRRALLAPPIYAELAERLAGRRVPEAAVLANLLYHSHRITASAKHDAAEAFLESARFAGALGDDQVLRPDGPAPVAAPAEPTAAEARPPSPARAGGPRGEATIKIELPLWDRDEGKVIRVRAPRSISAASFERFLQAFRLLVKVEDAPREG